MTKTGKQTIKTITNDKGNNSRLSFISIPVLINNTRIRSNQARIPLTLLMPLIPMTPLKRLFARTASPPPLLPTTIPHNAIPFQRQTNDFNDEQRIQRVLGVDNQRVETSSRRCERQLGRDVVVERRDPGAIVKGIGPGVKILGLGGIITMAGHPRILPSKINQNYFHKKTRQNYYHKKDYINRKPAARRIDVFTSICEPGI